MSTPLTGDPRPPAVFEPIKPTERVDVIDILRGLAILGILFVNIEAFSFPEGFSRFREELFPDSIDRIVRWTVQFLVEGKFYSLFSFLFGVGVAVQAQRAAEKHRRFAAVYCRRLLVLLAIGVVHDVFLWNGRILIAYALLGFVLIPFANRKPRTLLVWALILILLPVAVAPVVAVALRSAAPAAAQEDASTEAAEQRELERRGELDRQLELFRSHRYLEMVRFRIDALARTFQAIALFGLYMLGLFLLGMWAWRKRLFQRAAEKRRLIGRLMWWGLGLGLAGNAVLLGITIAVESSPSIAAISGAVAGFFIGNPSLCVFYIASIVLLAQRPSSLAILSRVIPVGRTALSNYLFQTVVCTSLFYGYGLGLYGSTRPSVNLLILLAVFVVQLVLSAWWIRRFRFGPAEWLWRSLTYGRAQPFKAQVVSEPFR